MKNIYLIEPNISCSYSDGTINTGSVGAFVNYLSTSSTVDNCYVINPTLTASPYAGQVAAIVYNSAATNNRITNCYFYDNNTGHNYKAIYTSHGTITNNGRAYTLNLGTGVTTTTAPVFSYGGTNYFAGTITLNHADPPTGYAFKGYTVNGSSISGNTFNINKDATVAAVYIDPFGIAGGANGSAEHPYVISNTDGWNYFCDCLEDNNTWNGFSGKIVKLSTNININRAAGSAGHEFKGTFDGDYHTIIANINETTTQGTAPFREIKGATIRKVVTSGNIKGTSHASGLVGFARGDASVTNTIERCLVLANVTVTTADQNGNYHCGGVVGHGVKSNLNISNTVYDGAITNSGNYVGGFQGWCDGNTITLSNCLFRGRYSGNGVFHPMAVRNKNSATTATVTNTYYTVVPTLTDAAYIAADGKKTTGLTYVPATLGNEVEELDFMTVYQGGLFFAGLYYAAPTLTTDGDGAYLINNATDWDMFCDALQDNATWDRFLGKTVKLGNSISVSRVAGSAYHDICGTFDGNHKTITFNCGTEEQPESGIAAPFSYTSENAVIKDLTVDGTIYASGDIAAGFVGNEYGNLTITGCRSLVTIYTSNKFAAGFVSYGTSNTTITNCESGVVIVSSVNGDGTHGGFIGRSSSSAVNTIDGCVFDGKLLTSNGTNSCGGFIGWYSGCTNTVTNSLYAPAAAAASETAITEGATFVRNNPDDTSHAPTITNCYYTEPLGTEQGKQAHSITAGDGVTLEAAGDTTVYDVSGISAFAVGMMRDGVLYAGEDDEMTLTLGCDVPESYVLIGYDVNAGTLTGNENPYTLTMPGEDVVVSANLVQQVNVSYVDADGTEKTATAIVLTGSETALDAGWYVVNHDINYTSTVTLNGDVNLILGNGKTMTVNTSEMGIDGITNDANLTIYGQTLRGGTLSVKSNADGIYCNGLVINSGNVEVTTLMWNCISMLYDLVINGGSVTTLCTEHYGAALSGRNVAINGGQMTAAESGWINATNAVTLGWTNEDDFITFGSISADNGVVKIAAGKAMTDGENTYDSTTPSDVLAALTDVTLLPVIINFVPGDVNGDGNVDVQDVSVTIDYILGNQPEVFNEQAADVNNDGRIDVQDVSNIIDIILGK